MLFYSTARFLKPYVVCNSCLDTANYIVPPKHKNPTKLLCFLILPSVQTNRGGTVSLVRQEFMVYWLPLGGDLFHIYRKINTIGIFMHQNFLTSCQR